MRRIIPLLLAILVSLQWSIAAAGQLLDLPDPDALRHAHTEPHGLVRANGHVHDPMAMSHADDFASAAPAGPITFGAVVVAADDASLASASDPDCPAGTHLHACCHIATMALPVAGPLTLPPSSSLRLVPAAVLPPRSRVPDGPFRPPRTVTA